MGLGSGTSLVHKRISQGNLHISETSSLKGRISLRTSFCLMTTAVISHFTALNLSTSREQNIMPSSGNELHERTRDRIEQVQDHALECRALLRQPRQQKPKRVRP